MNVIATCPVWRILAARAIPVACRSCVPTGELDEKMLCSRAPKWLGIWRPPDDGSLARANWPSMISRGVIPNVRTAATDR